MRVLYITTYHRTGGWLAEAFATDSAVDVLLEEAVGVRAGMSRLRDEVFDAVLISHEPGELDALELLDGLRAGGSEEPYIVLGHQSEQELAPLCYEVGGDAFVCVDTCTTRSLIWIVARAVERSRLQRENRRLAQADQHRLRLENDEAARLLGEQRAMVEELISRCASDRTLQVETFPERLVSHYRELLRTYVIMGSGNLVDEMAALAEMLASVNITTPEAMQLHLHALAELVRGLGSRSARHVMSRADLLAFELLVHLSECYRQRYFERQYPASQKLLPGFLTRS
jgi:DNA-binding response OmpR family regulator